MYSSLGERGGVHIVSGRAWPIATRVQFSSVTGSCFEHRALLDRLRRGEQPRNGSRERTDNSPVYIAKRQLPATDESAAVPFTFLEGKASLVYIGKLHLLVTAETQRIP